jgi:hypothetical protein
MGTYKVIQDIEAEDTIIGWMTPRQAVYAAIVIVSGFICFMLATRGAWWLAIPFLPHMILFAVLAGPFVHDQPSEVWLLAKIKFFLKPRRRIWDQSGIKELVTITVPKKIERNLTDGLTQSEVKSRLSALANTIDSRGWAVKNVNMNLYAQPAYATVDSDRLIDHSAMPQQVPDYDVYAADDVLDAQNNPAAQQLQQMVSQSTQAHRQQLIAQMQQPAPQATTVNNNSQSPWFIDPATPVNPVAAQDDTVLSNEIKQRKQDAPTGHMAQVSPASGGLQGRAQTTKIERAVVDQLAQNNDLNISTIARQANKSDDDNEVVISLR